MPTRLGKRVSLDESRDEAMRVLFAKELNVVRKIESNPAAHPLEPAQRSTDFHTLSLGYRPLLGQMMKLTSISDATQLQLKRTQERLSVVLNKVERLNKNLQTLNEKKDEILVLAAHDLRSLLSGISGGADFLAEGQATNEADQSLQISDLIQAIRNFSRTNALRKRMEVLVLSDSAGQRVLTDVPLFLRVAENLVSNALKYSPPGKTITVQLETGKSFLLLTVSVNGPGISESDQTKLFKKFAKLSFQPAGGKSAVGLGLAIVHRILQHLGRTTQCESRLGEGTTFSVCFPASHVGGV